MNPRPRAVTVIGWIFILIGTVSLGYDLWQLTDSAHRAAVMAGGHEGGDFALVTVTHALAIVAGVFMLRGANWARWLAVAWIVFHVAISLQEIRPLVIHVALAAVALYFLFRPNVSAFFRGAVAALLVFASWPTNSGAQSPGATRAQPDSLLDAMVGEWAATGTTRAHGTGSSSPPTARAAGTVRGLRRAPPR